MDIETVTDSPARRAADETVRVTRSTCPYCGVGCGVLIESRGARIVGVRGDPDHPANHGRLCTKGSTLHLSAEPSRQAATRLLQPMLRHDRASPPATTSWDAALDHTAQRLADIVQRHGPQAVGFYVSGQLLTEDYYVLHKLARGLIGTPHIDSNSRLCMSSAVVGYKQTLGADAVPTCYEDLDHADCVFIAGSNTAWAHPVLFRRLEAARARRPSMRVIVVDPRRTDTASVADLHLALQPGTDVMLWHGLLHLMIRHGWIDADYLAAHTQGFAELRALVQDYPPELVAQVCGLQPDDLLTAARWFAGVPDGWPAGVALPRAQRLRTLSLYCQGLNQSSSGTAKNVGLINLHLACGQIGRAGAGPFSLTGQPNAMGGREVGAMATLLSGHRDIANPRDRAEIAALWGLLPGVDLPAQAGLTAVEMFEAAAQGRLKALWIACTNPAQSLPDQTTVRRALRQVEFVVVQEAYATATTCAWADVLLPAATWAEKEGTVTNSERRISRVRAAVPPPAGPLGEGPWPDWRIAAAVGQRLQALLPPRAGGSMFAYATAEEVWNEHRRSTIGRDLDIGGLSYALLEHGPQQWPYPVGAAQGRPRLYEDGRFATADGRARLLALPYEPPAEERDERYPYALLTGRLRDQWHCMTRTGTVESLFGHAAEPCVDLHPQDMAEVGLTDGDLVRVRSRRGQIVLPARPSPDVGRRQCFIPMHWGGEYLGGLHADEGLARGVNALTVPATCPRSRQPELKHTAVRIEAAHLPWQVHAMAWLPAGEALRAQQALRPLLAQFEYAACVPVAPSGGVATAPEENVVALWFKAAHPAPPPQPDWLAQLGQALQLEVADIARYDDAPRGQHRRLRLQRLGDEVRLQAFLLAGQARSRAWLGALLRQRQALTLPVAMLLMDLPDPVGLQIKPASRTVCNCLGVTEAAITTTLEGLTGTAEERLRALQASLRCGTQCGSCVPGLRRLVTAAGLSTVAAVATETQP